MSSNPIDPISVAVIANRFTAITKEMGQVMLLTSRSPIFSESRDFVTAIFDAQGQLEYRGVLEQIHKSYNYLDHQKPGAATTNATLVRESGLESYLADRYAIVGTPDQCLATLQEMARCGVRKIWLNVHFDDKIGFIKRWSRDIMAKAD